MWVLTHTSDRPPEQGLWLAIMNVNLVGSNTLTTEFTYRPKEFQMINRIRALLPHILLYLADLLKCRLCIFSSVGYNVLYVMPRLYMAFFSLAR